MSVLAEHFKTVTVDKKHVESIMTRTKTATIRPEGDLDIEAGDYVLLQDNKGNDVGLVEIVLDFTKTADDLVDSLILGHRNYSSTGEFLEQMEEYYPDRKFHGQSRFNVYYFRVDFLKSRMEIWGRKTDGKM